MIELNKTTGETIQQSFDSESVQAWVVDGDVVVNVVGSTVEISQGSQGTHVVLVKACGLDPDLQHIQITIGA